MRRWSAVAAVLIVLVVMVPQVIREDIPFALDAESVVSQRTTNEVPDPQPRLQPELEPAKPIEPPYASILDSYRVDIAPGAQYTWYRMEIDRGLEEVHVVEFDPVASQLELVLATSGDKVHGREGVSEMAARADQEGSKVIAAVNGDFFDVKTGIPHGVSIARGMLLNTAKENRNAFGLRADGTALIGVPTVSLSVDIGEFTLPIRHLNRMHGNNQLVLYTPSFHTSTLTSVAADEYILEVLEEESRNRESLMVKVTGVREGKGNTLLEEGHMVLSALGTQKYRMKDVDVGDLLEVSVSLKREWSGVRTAVGAHRLLVKNGNVLQDDEAVHPRTAIGVKEDGSILMITIDGRAPGFSEGVTLEELGRIMKDLGAMEAVNLDGGGSSTFLVRMPRDEELITIRNKPSDGEERSVANALLLLYKGK